MTSPTTSVGVLGLTIDRITTMIRTAIGRKKGATADAFRDLGRLLKAHRDVAILMSAFLAVMVGAAVDRVRKNRSGIAFGLVSAATEAIEAAVATPNMAREFTAERAMRMVNPGLPGGDGGREVSFLQGDLALAEAQLSHAASTNRVQKDTILDLQARITELESDPQYTELAAAIVELTAANESLESEINAVVAEKDALVLENQVQAATITELNVQIAELEAELANAGSPETLSAALAQVDALTGQLATLITERDFLLQDRNDWQTAHEQLQAQMNALPSTATLQAEVANLTTATAAQANTIMGLQTNLSNAETQIAALQLQIANTPSTYTLETTINDLNTQITSLNNFQSSLQNDLASVNAQLVTANQNYANLVTDYGNQINSLNAQIADLQAQLAALQP